MSRFLQHTAVLLGLAGGLAAADSQITREGDYWVQSFSASEAIPPTARLRVTAPGPVHLSGASQDLISYVLKVRVKARSESQARMLMRSSAARLSRAGAYLMFIVPRGAGTAELDIKVPRSVQETVIATREGRVEALDLDGALRAETGGGSMKADRIRGNLTLSTSGGDIVLGNIDGAVRCVTGGGPVTAGIIRGEAVFETGGGDIRAQEVDGLVRAATGGGTIRIARAGSAVIASTGGGTIQVESAKGMVTAKNAGGPVQVGSAAGVRCETAAGAIRLARVSGSLRVSTAVGNIIANLLAGQPLADSFLTTGSGDITVMIPSNLAVTIRAENELADTIRRIVSEFPGISVRLQGGQVIAEGAINGGGPLLRLSGTGGTIFIKREP